MFRGLLVLSLLPALLLPAASSARPAAPAGVRQAAVSVSHLSGGELTIDARRDLVLTADRSSTAQARPSVSVVGAREREQVGLISLASLPAWAGPSGPTPHVPSGIDSDASRGVVVTTNSASGTVAVVPVTAREARAEHLVSVGAHPFGVAIDERRGLAYVASHGEHRIDIVDVERRRVVGTIGGVVAPTKLALDERRGRLYVGNADRSASPVHELAVIDTWRRAVIDRIPVDPNSRPAVDPVDGTVYAASFVTGAIAVVDPVRRSVRSTIATGSTPHGIAVDRRRGLLYAPNLLANTVTVIDARREAVVDTLPVPGVPLGVDVDQERGAAWVSLRDASQLVVIEPGPLGADEPRRAITNSA